LVSRPAVVTGAPGVGKTTVVDGALKKLEEMGAAYELVNYGDVMLEIARERAGVSDRDKMRELKYELYREVQEGAADEIAKRAREKPVLVDTHCTVKKPEGYLPGLPKHVLERLDPRLIIVVEAVPEEIAGRRGKDASRRRDEELRDEIAEHQQLNRAVAMAYAAMTGGTVKIIKNREGKVSEAVEEMVEVLR
jgi:adenylate kinase